MRIIKKLKDLLSDKSGNIAVTFALSLMPVLLSVGAAIDYTRASELHTRVAHATDAALLAAVSNAMQNVDLDDAVAVNKALKAEFEPFLLANLSGESGYTYNGFNITYDPVTKGVNVDVDLDYNTAIFGIIGVKNWDADVFAATSMQMKSGGAFSMFLVLDRSGSMGWSNGDGGSKMQSLQAAVGKMISNFEKSDPDQEYIRMGAVAYSSYTWNKKNIDWKLSKVTKYVNDMYANGGTNSAGAVDVAYTELTKNKETKKHEKKSGQTPDLIMVFMTDGDNNHSSYDTSTKATCDKAKAKNIEIYTVAFQAPTSGQNLLKYCATSTGHYFEPENTNELISSFNNIGKNVAEKLVLSK